MKELTAQRLREVLHYNPDSGDWIWLKTLSVRREAGSPAGEVKSSGYLFIGVDGSRYRAHRLAWLYMTGVWPTEQVDHINGVRSDNRWINLRAANNTQNAANMRVRYSNIVGVKGVKKYEGKRGVRWRAAISIQRKTRHLGSFASLEEAQSAYALAAKEAWGVYASTGDGQ